MDSKHRFSTDLFYVIQRLRRAGYNERFLSLCEEEYRIQKKLTVVRWRHINELFQSLTKLEFRPEWAKDFIAVEPGQMTQIDEALTSSNLDRWEIEFLKEIRLRRKRTRSQRRTLKTILHKAITA